MSPADAGAVVWSAAPTAAWRRRAGRGLWAVLDQGFFALSNLTLGVLLARWLTAREYGAFALAFSVFLLFGTVYSALVPEPMLVFGTSRYAAAFGAYLRRLLAGHALVTGVGSAAFAAAGGAFQWCGAPVMAHAFLSWAAAAPCVTLSWLLRRACFARGRPDLAAGAGAAQLGMTVGLLSLLAARGTLTLFTAVATSAAVNVATSGWLLVRLRRGIAPPGGTPEGDARGVLRLHWEYGRWAAAGGILSWVASYSYYVVLPYWAGLEASAALRALYTLGIPVAHAQTALATLLIPALVRARGGSGFGRLVRQCLVAFGAASVAGWLVLGVTGPRLVHLAYRGRYDAYGPLLWTVAAVPITAGAGDVLRSALRAQERPDRVFWGYVVAAATTATLGMALTYCFHVLGPALGEIASGAAAVAVMAFALARRGPAPATPRTPTP